MKKSTIKLEKSNFIFEYNNQKVKALNFNPNNKQLEILHLEEDKKEIIAFIHIPKNIKKLISPL